MKALIFSCLLITTVHVAAQSNLTVTYTRGNVYYYSSGNNSPKSIYPGITLSPSGRIRCDKGAKVKLLCKGKVFELTDNKMHFLDEIAREAGDANTLSFLGRFWVFISGSMDNTEDDQHLEQHHKQSMENLRAGIKGYASHEFTIQADILFEGGLSDTDVAFMWNSVPDMNYCFRLTRQADDDVILIVWTKVNVLRLNLGELALVDGEVYEWQIITEENDPTAPHSRKMQFAFQPAAASRALSEVARQKAYQTASPVEQQLMEIFALETNQFYYDVNVRYQKLTADNPENVLVKRAYASFLASINKLESAKTLLK